MLLAQIAASSVQFMVERVSWIDIALVRIIAIPDRRFQLSFDVIPASIRERPRTEAGEWTVLTSERCHSKLRSAYPHYQ
jgi:hypothetical protein